MSILCSFAHQRAAGTGVSTDVRATEASVEHEEQADRAEREADKLEEHSDDLGQRIEDVSDDWKAKKSDSTVPGAQEEGDEEEQED
jgi:hypothetical protein